MTKCRSVVTGFVLLTVSLAPLPCFAQASRSGPTFNIGGTASPVRFPDVAHDTINNQYLVVNGTGFIEGQLLNAAGAKIGGFTVNASRGLPGQDAQCPRVFFTADLNGGAGGYLITWHETFSGVFARIHGRIFSTAGTPLTGDFVLTPEIASSALSSNWGMGAAIAYSTTSREFLVTWMGSYGTTNDIRFTRLNLAGTVLQASRTITAGTIDWERDPAVDYNPATDEFLIAYAGYWNAPNYAYIAAQRVKAGTGALIGAPRELIQTVAAYIPTVTYNPATAQYLITWYNATRTSAAMYGVSLQGADATPASAVRVMSARYTSYDALDVKYNTKSGDFLLVTYGASPQIWEDAAVSVKPDGTPYDNGFIVTNTPDVRPVRSNVSSDGNFSPRLIDDSSTGRWLMVTSSVFISVYGQFVASQNSSGPGTGPPPPPPPATSAPVMSLDVPLANAQVSTNGFFVSGWALDKAAALSSGSGIDFVHVYAWPIGGGPAIFLGAATLGAPQRPDVAGYYGSQFAGSGFSLTTGPLPPGTYNIAVYAHNTLGNTIDGRLARVTAVAPFSRPRMWVDSPAANQTTAQNLSISGWALDMGSLSDAGVDVVHVYAYPAAGGAAIFVGAATYGTARGDVGAAFGSSRFNHCGFTLGGTLAPGDYTLVVFARSSVTGTFNDAQAVPIKVR